LRQVLVRRSEASAVLRGQVGLQKGNKTALFGGNGFPDNRLLHGGIARQDNTLTGAKLEQDAQQVVGFGADTGSLEHDLVGLLALLCVSMPIPHILQNELALVLERARVEQPQVVGGDKKTKLVDDEDQIEEHIGQLDREKALFGLEVPELEHEEGLNGFVGEGLHKCGFGGRQSEVIGTLLVGEVWPVVECSDLGGIEQVQTFGALGGGFGCWTQESSPQSQARSLRAAGSGRGVCKQTTVFKKQKT
jgi:hypothetical protein